MKGRNVMRTIICAALLLSVPTQLLAQDAGVDAKRMHKPFVITKELDLTSCAMSQQGGEAVLAATIIVGGGPGGGPRVERSGGVAAGDLDHDGVDFSWSWGVSNPGSSSTGGAGRIVPTVTANSIKTKGTGGIERGAGQVCAAPPPGQRLLLPAVQKREARPVATCVVSGDAERPTFTVSMPLSSFGPNAKTGHVSLIKRGESARGPIVRCDWSAVPGAGSEKVQVQDFTYVATIGPR